ncbi:MAG: type II toxin-antitoxin system ParD family antitoxin [Planctomycetes bacterium]|nr:type II toxin-antitoxin system ParD family antitoxin [Planctomycetota bacterium]
MNVSLPAAMEQFVRAQVDSGRYRTVSEVMRDGLRLLEEAEQRRLVEKWLYEDLTPEEEALLPPEIKNRVKDHFTRLVDEARTDVDAGRITDGPKAMKRIEDRLRTRFERKP